MAADLLDKYGSSISNLTLIPSSGGVYEVTKNDKIILSKKELNRFPKPLEVEDILEQYEWIT